MLWLTPTFLFAVLGSPIRRLWLSSRQIGAVRKNRDQVPLPFADRISSSDHQKAADYTVANAVFGRASLFVEVSLLLGLTLGGGIAAIDTLWDRTGWLEPWRGA